MTRNPDEVCTCGHQRWEHYAQHGACQVRQGCQTARGPCRRFTWDADDKTNARILQASRMERKRKA